MNLSQLILSLVGTLIGGLATLSGIWIKNRLDERNNTQKWFEEQYLLGAVEPLLTALRTMEISIIVDAPTKEPPIELNRDTMNKVGRIAQILQSDPFERLLILAVSHLQKDERDVARLLAQGLAHSLHELRQVLLEQRIKRKSDVLQLANTESVKAIAERLQRLDASYEKAISS